MIKKSQKKIVPDIYSSYLKMIENSLGTRLFQNFYVRIRERVPIDAVEGGRLSCALFVSFILNNFGLIKKSHTTVKSTLKDMKDSGWFEINTHSGTVPRGAVLVWERKKIGSAIHKHLGFYIGKNQAISNSFHRRKPVCHHWTFGKKGSKNYRKIIKIFWNKKLN